MRIGIFSDVHANLEALLAVKDAYATLDIDQMVCLGDTVGYGGDPDACADLVQEMVAFTVLGNHDAAVASRMDFSYYYGAAKDALIAHREILSEKNLNWLKSLPYTYNEGVQCFCHGSPVNPEAFDYVFTVSQAAGVSVMFKALAGVTFIGHSHLCKAFAVSEDHEATEVITGSFPLREGYRYLISVGSVGQPRDQDPRASYTVFDTDAQRFEFRRVSYDIEGASKKIIEAGLEPTFAERLYLGV